MRQKLLQGFTLVELLVVIAIIGLLSTMAMVGLSGARQKARDTKRLADVRQIMISLELYNNDFNGYPIEANPVTLGVGEFAALCEDGFEDKCDAGETVFQGLIPNSPTPQDGDCTVEQNVYAYTTGTSGEYSIQFCLGGSVGTFLPGLHSATPSGIQ
ncbi:MAG: type II secretion system protein [Patescibacteria group bacterium]